MTLIILLSILWCVVGIASLAWVQYKERYVGAGKSITIGDIFFIVGCGSVMGIITLVVWGFCNLMDIKVIKNPKDL